MPEYQQFCEALARFGLKPRELPTFQANAVGVGGATKFVLSAELPVGVCGSSGAVIVHVVDTSIPLLLPMSFCNVLGMVLDTTEKTATWKYLETR